MSSSDASAPLPGYPEFHEPRSKWALTELLLDIIKTKLQLRETPSADIHNINECLRCATVIADAVGLLQAQGRLRGLPDSSLRSISSLAVLLKEVSPCLGETDGKLLIDSLCHAFREANASLQFLL